MTIPKAEERPKCRRCRRTLKMETWNVWRDSEDDPPPIGFPLLRFNSGGTLTNRGIIRKRKALGRWRFLCWSGRYGYAGQGHFCTLSCGWRWACDRLEGKV